MNRGVIYDGLGGTVLEIRHRRDRVEIDDCFGSTLIIELADEGYVDSEYLDLRMITTATLPHDACRITIKGT